MKRWKALIRVCDDQIGMGIDLDGKEFEHIVDRTTQSDKYWDDTTEEPSGYGGYWYKVEVTSDEIGVDDDGNPTNPTSS